MGLDFEFAIVLFAMSSLGVVAAFIVVDIRNRSKS